MGKVEKVIVLSVLFLIALILVVSVTVEDPLDTSRVVEAGAKAPLTVANAPAVPPASDPALLNAAVIPPPAPADSGPAPIVETSAAIPPPAASPAVDPAAAAAPVPGLPAGALLKKVDGLEDSFQADLKIYAWKEGDTWRKIAQEYYGDARGLAVLKQANEGRMDVRAGEKVFVPVFDGAGAPAVASAAPAGAPATAAATGGSRIHVVKSGESLWKISKLELGEGHRWKEIHDANRDVLGDKPENVKQGMRLRIP